MRRRWPGVDGWLLAVGTLVVATVVTIRGLTELRVPVLVLVLAVGLFSLITRRRRTPKVVYISTRPTRVLIVIPTHDNATTIAAMVHGALKHGPVVVVDDGSRDGSGLLAQEAGATLLTHSVNRGKGAALETTLAYADAEGFSHIVAMDADGQHLPNDLPGFLSAIQARPDAVLAGCRADASMPKGAAAARANSNFWVWVSTGRYIADTQCGFRAYPVAVRELALVPSRYQWEVEVLVRAVWAGVPVVDHPCEVYYPPKGERVSSYRKVVDTARITWLNAHLIAERVLWPPRWFPGQATWRGSTRGSIIGWRFVLGAIRRLGPRHTKALLFPVVGFYWLFLGGQRAGLNRYLTLRLGEAKPWDRFRVLRAFAGSLVDRLAFLNGLADVHIDRSQVSGLKEHLETETRGLVVVTGHLGNPDLASALFADRGRTANVMVFASPGDAYLELLAASPRAPRLLTVNDGNASLEALRRLRDGEIVAVKGDRAIDKRTCQTLLLGQTVTLPTGPWLLAGAARVPVLYLGCFETEPGTYQFVADGPHEVVWDHRSERDACVAAHVERWAQVLEEWTEAHPHQWFNFFDLWG